jgi:hypothetical protein
MPQARKEGLGCWVLLLLLLLLVTTGTPKIDRASVNTLYQSLEKLQVFAMDAQLLVLSFRSFAVVRVNCVPSLSAVPFRRKTWNT